MRTLDSEEDVFCNRINDASNLRCYCDAPVGICFCDWLSFPLIDCSVQALLGLGTGQIVNVLDDVVEKPEDDFYKLYILTNSLAKYFCISCETLKSIFSQVYINTP